MEKDVVLTVQGRGRVNLGKLALYERYFARLQSDGSIILEPAVLLPASQVRATEGKAPTDGNVADSDLPIDGDTASHSHVGFVGGTDDPGDAVTPAFRGDELDNQPPIVRTAEEIFEIMKSGVPPTDCDVPWTLDGQVIDTREKTLEWLRALMHDAELQRQLALRGADSEQLQPSENSRDTRP